ncbi:protein FAR1-RELATED SEQUENCE 11-like isoform X2 [Magnolia sinica]|uniref:protein FAR1-RELATED SEQUENCE 11-like isoform X2 n=1 Tax=Magnolia sinica TaxID=86752 RepID=UPI002658327F|nr:protein FAR1-RELATED SEQUENCE 11-like isoform X2 [Magnolia sinica]
MENPSRPAPRRDPYEVLGVSRVSTDLEIKTAYRKLALKYHPDKNVGNHEASESFKEVAYSYNLLSSPDRRQHYDSDGFEALYLRSHLYIMERISEESGLVMEASDTGTDLSPDDIGTVEETPEETILSRQTSVNLVPFIGQRFVSQDAAYEFYCSFAKQCGFTIRRHRTRGKDGVGRGITRRDFTCHRGGYPQLKPSDESKLHRNRKSSRCGCPAYMRIVKRADFDVAEWRITGFSNTHNHELLKSNDVHLLHAYCTISADDKSRICMFTKAGMSVRQMLRLMELEKGVKLGCLPFTEIDVRNLLQSFRNVDRDDDVIDFLTMCKTIKDEDPNFKYDFKIDSHNRLEHIAWSYASSVRSYEAFGDAVVFDTTHRLDAYDMLLGIWIGVDNHGMNCFFGCVLLRDENMHSFSWALKVAVVVEFRDQAGVKQKMQQKLRKVGLKTGSPIESHAATILTPHAFCKLQEELVLAPQYASFQLQDGCFLVRHHTQMDGGCKVIWVPREELISCSCHQFEFSGILCRHVLRVLSTNNCFHIPDQYLPIRWRGVTSSPTKLFRASLREHADRVQLLESMVSSLISESVESEERLDFSSEQIAMVLSRIKEFPRSVHGTIDIAYGSPTDSLILPEVEDSDVFVQSFASVNHEAVALGKLKQRRMRDVVEISRKRRRCPVPCCGQFGHDVDDCSIMEDESLNSDVLGFL